jgi:hypothetical protein
MIEESENKIKNFKIENQENLEFYRDIYEEIANNLNIKYLNNNEQIKIDSSLIKNFQTLKINLQNIIDLIINTKLEKEILQYKQIILNLEQGKKYLIQQNFLKKTKIDMLENEICAYMEMEEEFEEMKIKFKYDDGEFLKNEKKENEILILRAENSNLKISIKNNEKIKEDYEEKILELQNKIKKLEVLKNLNVENKYSNSKPKEHLTGRTNNINQITYEITSKENKSFKNYFSNNPTNNNSTFITINNNYVKNKQKTKIQRYKKNSNIVLNMKQVRKGQKSTSNLFVSSSNNNSHNKLIKSSSTSTLTKHSINSNNIINVNINYIDNISNYISKSNKKTNLTKHNSNNSKIKVPFNKDELMLMKYKNNSIKSPYNSKSHNNSNILYNIFNHFPMTTRSKNQIKKNIK